MDIRILQGTDGAKKAEGLTVVIDVFRAFSVECFLTEMQVGKILPMSDIDECLKYKSEHPDYYLIGERKGVKLPSFDQGNSPSLILAGPDLKGKTIVHCTSAGTQGAKLAAKATETLGACLLNASATASYIRDRNPNIVSLVAMGLDGTQESPEDTICAEYIKAKILGKEINIHSKIAELKKTAGKKFFDHKDGVSFPEADFFMCLVPDVFDYVLKLQ